MTRHTQMRVGFGAAIIVAFLTGFVTLGSAAEFSADMVQKTHGQTMTGKVFVKGTRMRMEMNHAGGSMVTIALPDQHKSIVLMPAQKMYMESITTPAQEAPKVGDRDLEQRATVKQLGTEEVNGYKCEKYEIIPRDASAGKITQWVSKELSYPLKSVHQGPQGEATTEYQNIKQGGVADSLFQIPPGYQKMQMPGMGGGMAPGAGSPHMH
jgi:outer membrane lipoprotein-sorting protein